jgi:hypothetical protein
MKDNGNGNGNGNGKRRLFTTTYAHSERLAQLLRYDTEFKPAQRDLIELWSLFSESEAYVGVPPTLQDFADWILGTHTEGRKCEVTW